jgi:DNA transposition AAA+ family ATPase
MEFTKERKTEIVEKLASYVERIGSQNKAAQLLGISSAYVSQLRSGKWEKIGERTWRLLAKQLLGSDWQLVKTHNFATIERMCADCQHNGLMRCLTGYSGAGKTTALRYYSKEYREVAYVHCLEGTTKKQFLQDILTALGVEAAGNERQLLLRIQREFLSMEAPLLILDDAGKLPLRLLQKVQQIYDLTRDELGTGQLGILLSGVDYMYDNLRKWALSERAGAPELKRRVGFNQQLAQPTREEIATIARENGVEDGDVIGLLIRYSRDFGTLAEHIRNYHRLGADASAEDFAELLNPAA